MFFTTKRTLLFFWILFSLLFASAQDHGGPEIKLPSFQNPVLLPAKPKAGTEATLIIRASIAEKWHVYGTDQNPEVFVEPAELVLDKSTGFEVIGKPQSVGTHTYDDEFMGKGINQWSTENPLEIRQKIRILRDDPTVTGFLKYQTCAEVCVQKKYKFTIQGADRGAADKQVATTKVSDSAKSARYQKDTAILQAGSTTNRNHGAKEERNGDKEGANSAQDPLTGMSFWALILFSFFGGLSALVTPCVFPMIPMTVSYFTKNTTDEGGSKKGIRNGLLFGLSIILIYTVPGTIVGVLAGPSFANWLSTHWLPNILFFAIFLLFGASFLGMFEIVLPSRFVNKIDSKGNKNSLGGIFFMAFTLVLVSFSCTGPVVSFVFAQTISGEVTRPLFSMLAFSFAIALPFAFFAIFPSMMQSLPKSGGWLNAVKVSLGFIEIAAALKFLSIPDQTYHWHLLDREIYLAFWIVIFSLWGLYLLGKIKFSHDSDLPYLSVPRMLLAIVVFTFVVYMIPGMWGAPLKGLAGYLPPLESQDFRLNEGTSPTQEADTDFPAKVKYGGFLTLPHGIKGFFDFKEASDYAKKVGKPIFIDFTGHGCVNCRKMEENVWRDPAVLQRLKNDYVVVALYADDKTILPESTWFTSTIDGEVKKTVGDQNSDLQFSRYQGAAQPQYVLVDANGNRLLNYDKYYDPEVANFVKFLDEGKAVYQKK